MRTLLGPLMGGLDVPFYEIIMCHSSINFHAIKNRSQVETMYENPKSIKSVLLALRILHVAN